MSFENTTTHRVVIGRKLGFQRFELNGAGRVTYLTPETVMDDAVRAYLDSGQCVQILADVEPGPAGDIPSYVAVRVRELAPNSEDYARYRLIFDKFEMAGVYVSVPDASVRFAEPDFPFWDPFATVFRAFVATQPTFPTSWWDDEPERGVQEMVSLLEELELRGRFPRAQLLQRAQRDLEAESGVEAEHARDQLCAALVVEANQLAEEAGAARRFCGPFDKDGEPTWMYFEPRGYESLMREALIEPWSGRTSDVASYQRPPDRGELDLDQFPPGDEPF